MERSYIIREVKEERPPSVWLIRDKELYEYIVSLEEALVTLRIILGNPEG